MKWSKDADRRLLAAIRSGLSIRAAARHLKVSECAAIARHNRIKGIRFPSDLGRDRDARARMRARAERERAAMERMESLLRLGANRNTAIIAARAMGATLDTIASRVGVSRARIWKIADNSRS